MVDITSRPDGSDDRWRPGRRDFLAVLGAAGMSTIAAPAIAQDEEDDGNESDGDADGGGGAGETVEVLLVDFAYEPGTDSPLEIPPGTTVLFVWETDNHNINVTSQPDESDWEGHMPIENSGFEHEHTFEVEGEYEFHCDPHLNLGMEGTIVVSEEATVGGGEGAGGPADLVPDPAMTLLIATMFSMAAVLGLSYVFMKYGGRSQ